jgi:hypothetical protein
MATQKTNIIKEIIRQAANKDINILLITTRRSLAKESYEKYKDMNFSLYSNKDYKIGQNLIVQFDSLYKYDTDFFDLVIIDEITALMLYITDHYEGKAEQYRKNVNTLLSLKQKKVILDAFIIDNPYEDEIDGVLISNKTYSIYNKFREDLSIIEYEDLYYFVSKINRMSSKGLVSVSSNEKRFLHKLKKLLEKHGKKVLLVSADTLDYSLDNISEYDAFLYSPVITVGVSFFFNVQGHFHYDNSSSIDPVSSIQMIRRVRNAKSIHYFIKARSSYKSTDLEKIEKTSKVLQYFKMFNYFGEYIGLTKVGERMLRIIKMKNIFENTHKYAFRELMKFQFKEVKFNRHKMDKFKF